MSQQSIQVEIRRPLVDGRVRHFLRHLGEMTLTMMIGMALLSGVFREGFEAASAGVLRNAELSVLAMAFGMSLPMAMWMRHRGHGWRPTLEMSVAMILPAAALLLALRLDLLTGRGALTVQHVLMLPSMVVAMLHRRHEYAH